MSKKCVCIGRLLVLLALVVSVSGSVYAQSPPDPQSLKDQLDTYLNTLEGKLRVNMEAYRDITFQQMFGGIPSFTVLALQANAPSACTNDTTGISLADFFKKVYDNLHEFDPSLEKTVVADIKKLIGADVNTGLRGYLEKTNGPGGTPLKDWRVGTFFDTNVKKVYGGAGVITDLFDKYFVPIEELGLTLPWLWLGDAGDQAFRDLCRTPFLQRLGKMTYPHFFLFGMDHPLADDELIDLSQAAIQVGLFGALHTYRDDPKRDFKAADISTLFPKSLLATSCCCNKVTKTCQAYSNPSYKCSMCGAACCLGSNWCP